MDEFAEQVVNALNDLTGRHAAHRAAHAKGTLMAGTFTPSGAGLTTAAHMSGEPVPVTLRFSNCRLARSCASRTLRGLQLSF